MKNLLVILCFISVTITQCKKEKTDETGLPIATQTGANTFGCLINGVVFTPKSKITTNRPKLEVYLIPSANNIYTFKMVANDYVDQPVRSLSFYLLQSLEEGRSYSLQENSQTTAVQYRSTNGSEFYVRSPLTGLLTITKLDQTSRIIAGTFSFDAISSKDEKVSITEGRFDVKF